MSLRFTTLEYVSFERGKDWYWILGIVAIAIGVACIILGNILFGIVVIVSAFGIALYTARKPKTMQVEIDPRGITIDKTLFPYSALESFCISRDTHPERLRIRSKKKILPLMSVIIANVSSESVQEELSQHLPEEEFEISFIEKLMEAFGL